MGWRTVTVSLRCGRKLRPHVFQLLSCQEGTVYGYAALNLSNLSARNSLLGHCSSLPGTQRSALSIS